MSKGEGIRIFLRVRPPPTSKHSNFLSSSNGEHATCDYDIENSFQGSDIKFHVSKREVGEFVNNSSEDYKFSFRRVFDQRASQEEVFNVVSKDCVMSVLDGYNSTIFAYGQTGSGKTYSITGGTESYQDRGIIPRALAMVYDEIAKRTDTTWNVNLSYLQIYNDKGQDLLNHGKDAKTLEDLSPVTVHEGEEEVTLKGLEQHRAPALADALNLLFLGDTNRLYCETPMNKTSSRSHCVFTVSLEARSGGSSVIRRSKLNLVDLAGSERVSKTGVNGTLLSEAKYINLSLHYLEHVIIALSEQAKGKRDHVPYRNSFMTMVLRDSLGGNCRTSMLATAHMAKSMLPETISTCQFAQRVALIRQNAHVNEVTDPLLLVKKLKAEVSQLKDRLAFHEGGGAGADRALTDDEKHLCRGLVDTYMENSDPEARIEGFEGDLARIYYCFSLLKDMTKSGKGSSGGGNVQASRDIDNGSFASAATMAELDGKATKYRQQVEELQLSLQQKENEMNVLFDMLQQTQRMKFNVETQTVDVSSSNSSSGAMDVVQREVVDAHQLIRSLRSGGRRGSMMVLSQTQAIPPTAALSSSVITTQAGAAEAAKAHVTTLATAGKLTEAEATAAQEYFARKEERLAESYNLSALTDAELLNDRTAAFEAFKQSYRNYSKVEATKAELKQKYDDCKSTARSLNACVDSIKQVKTQVQRLRAERAVDGVEEIDPEEATLLQRLGSEKDVYNTLAATLRSQKEGIDGMHAFMKRAQDQLTRDFEDWLATRQKQVARAMSRGAQPGGGGGAHEQVPISSQVAHPPPSVGAAVSGGGGGHTGLTFPSPGIAQSARTASAGKLHSAPTMSSQLASTASATIAPLTSHMNNTAVLSSTAVASTLNNGGSGAAAAAGVMGRHPASAPSAAGYNEVDSAGIATGRQGSLPSPRLGAGSGGLPVASIANQWIAPAGAAVGSPLGPSPPLNRSRLAVNLTSPTDANAGGGGGSSNSLLASTNGVSSTNVVGASGKWMSSPPSNPYHLAPLNTKASGIENSSPQSAVAVSNSSTGDMNARNFLMTTSTTTNTTTSATASEVDHQYLPGRNPYAPEHRSTGNTAADEQLAALYRAREELRKQFQ